MLKEVEPQERPNDLEATTNGFNVALYLGILRRQIWVLAGGGLIGALLALLYLWDAPPQYRATTQVLLDGQKASAVQDLTTGAAFMFETGAVDSQVVLIQSTNVAAKVLNRLQLMEDPDRLLGKPGPISGAIKDIKTFVSDLLSWSSAEPEASPQIKEYITRRQILGALAGGIEVRRLGRTYALELSFTAPDQILAAEIVNAFAEAYIEDQLGSKYDATRRATDWMQSRINELRDKALSSDMAVQRFKAESNLTSTDGRLLADQELSQVTSQLVLARADKSSADARYKQIQDLIASGDPDSSIAESLNNSVISELRGRYLRASKMEADFSARYGPNHIQARNLRDEMGNYKRLMLLELERVAQTLKSEAEIAAKRVESLENGLSGLSTRNIADNEQMVNLRELEREAAAYDSLYQEFLKRYQESIQRQSFPISEARVITPAEVPLAPNTRKNSVSAALLLVVGLAGGACVAAAREYRDRGFRTSEQISSHLGIEMFGMVPKTANDPKPERPSLSAEGRKRGAGQQPVILANRTPLFVDAADFGKRSVPILPPVLSAALDAPHSQFAETMRAAKMAIDVSRVGRPSKVIGIASLLPGEGKTTIAKNLASNMAHSGARTIIIDADLRNPGLTRSVTPFADAGLVEVLLGERNHKDLIYVEKASGLHVLPGAMERHYIPHTSEVLSSPTMSSLLADLGREYEYVLLDLPPIGPVIDTRVVSQIIDSFVFVVEWGATSRSSIVDELRKQFEVRNKILGVILNKVDPKRLSLYQSAGDVSYYSARYKSYLKN
ncbi:polysaccharide biosynthesis tyrosine autokinase [Chthonobacter albigriseus]|uniref:polysaccharide biosynthesis tyrosine autokinase n=1 Tax=Chthonobacter albigriseus TaxID=1683161 RepID=UPI0015EEB13E|nr:polysaccharide biosynthesis tyrosine autokinase [Chthonobacter albigriseus]